MFERTVGCRLCAQDFYRRDMTSPYCTRCPDGTGTIQEGSVRCLLVEEVTVLREQGYTTGGKQTTYC